MAPGRYASGGAPDRHETSGSSHFAGKRGTDLQEEVFRVAVPIGHPLDDLDPVVHALQHAGVQPVALLTFGVLLWRISRCPGDSDGPVCQPESIHRLSELSSYYAFPKSNEARKYDRRRYSQRSLKVSSGLPG